MTVKNSYWNHAGAKQEAYARLFNDLVARTGTCQTVEGELLRAASKIYHDAYNNGGGNNMSGPLRYLEQNLPSFRQDWSEELGAYVLGEGRYPTECYGLLEEVVTAVVDHVSSKNGVYAENSTDMWSLTRQPTDEVEHEGWGGRRY